MFRVGRGTRGIITIYCDHRGHHNPCMSPVSEQLHILNRTTRLLCHRSESTVPPDSGRGRGWANISCNLRNKFKTNEFKHVAGLGLVLSRYEKYCLKQKGNEKLLLHLNLTSLKTVFPASNTCATSFKHCRSVRSCLLLQDFKFYSAPRHLPHHVALSPFGLIPSNSGLPRHWIGKKKRPDADIPQ
jgi:hypothetical protein